MFVQLCRICMYNAFFLLCLCLCLCCAFIQHPIISPPLVKHGDILLSNNSLIHHAPKLDSSDTGIRLTIFSCYGYADGYDIEHQTFEFSFALSHYDAETAQGRRLIRESLMRYSSEWKRRLPNDDMPVTDETNLTYNDLKLLETDAKECVGLSTKEVSAFRKTVFHWDTDEGSEDALNGGGGVEANDEPANEKSKSNEPVAVTEEEGFIPQDQKRMLDSCLVFLRSAFLKSEVQKRYISQRIMFRRSRAGNK